jgi:hypothetical protein
LLPELFDAFNVLSGVGNAAGSFGTLLSSELFDAFNVSSGVSNAVGASAMNREGGEGEP